MAATTPTTTGRWPSGRASRTPSCSPSSRRIGPQPSVRWRPRMRHCSPCPSARRAASWARSPRCSTRSRSPTCSATRRTSRGNEFGLDFEEKYEKCHTPRIARWLGRRRHYRVHRQHAPQFICDLREFPAEYGKVAKMDVLFGSESAAFRIWGANPTVITFAEVYNALQTVVVDGAVMPPDLM